MYPSLKKMLPMGIELIWPGEKVSVHPVIPVKMSFQLFMLPKVLPFLRNSGRQSKASEEEEDIDDLTDSRCWKLPKASYSKTTSNLMTHFSTSLKPSLKIVILSSFGLGYGSALLSWTLNVSLYNLKANVMLSYKIPAAVTLLKSKLEVAQTSLDNTIEDLEFLREQFYNWDVKRRRELQEAEALELGTALPVRSESLAPVISRLFSTTLNWSHNIRREWSLVWTGFRKSCKVHRQCLGLRISLGWNMKQSVHLKKN